jgi:hypothetical protein
MVIVSAPGETVLPWLLLTGRPRKQVLLAV